MSPGDEQTLRFSAAQFERLRKSASKQRMTVSRVLSGWGRYSSTHDRFDTSDQEDGK